MYVYSFSSKILYMLTSSGVDVVMSTNSEHGMSRVLDNLVESFANNTHAYKKVNNIKV